MMNLNELLPTLRQLPRADTLRALQFLSSDLAGEEASGMAEGGSYPIWSPYDSIEAARILEQSLEPLFGCI